MIVYSPMQIYILDVLDTMKNIVIVVDDMYHFVLLIGILIQSIVILVGRHFVIIMVQ